MPEPENQQNRKKIQLREYLLSSEFIPFSLVGATLHVTLSFGRSVRLLAGRNLFLVFRPSRIVATSASHICRVSALFFPTLYRRRDSSDSESELSQVFIFTFAPCRQSPLDKLVRQLKNECRIRVT